MSLSMFLGIWRGNIRNQPFSVISGDARRFLAMQDLGAGFRCLFHANSTHTLKRRSRTARDEECVLERSPLLENARKHASSRGPLSSVSNAKGWLGRSQSESEIACLEWSDEWETTSLEFTSFSLQTLFETMITTEVQVAKAGRGLISRCVLRLVKQGWRGGDGESL